MHYTLHLTDSCNLACRYCYVKQSPQTMTPEITHAAVDLAARSKSNCGIIFFGGEPLLCRDLIYDAVTYGETIDKKRQNRFHYKITTNGLLLDDEFLRYSLKHEIFIALSFDGIRVAHDANRVSHSGGSTYEVTEKISIDLLAARPYAPVLMTVSPNTVQYYAESVGHLYSLGFKYLICSIDYAGAWDEKTLAELKKQYKKLAAFYKEKTLAEEKFYLSPFEVKLSSHIHGDTYCAERCELGKKQISVAPDGKLYPCVQFVGDVQYSIGDVWNGIDEEKRRGLYLLNEKEKEECAGCAVAGRCNHHCACLNKQATGNFRTASPVLCAHERMLLPIVDALAEDLYKKRSALFIQKQYNDMFPLLSLAEDKLKK